MPQSIFESAARWVIKHHNLSIPVPTSENDIAQSLASLHASAGKCEACIMVPDLFPGAALEAIYVPKLGLKKTSVESDTALKGGAVTQTALMAIGNALVTYLTASDNDMAHYQFDDGAQAVVYFPSERATVLQAMGLTLLEP